jgi:protein-disulfide isomerase
MKQISIAAMVAIGLTGAACHAKEGASGNASATADSGKPVHAVTPPKNGDWTTVVTATDAGGFMMGNPNAKVHLVEYGSMTCPHCQRFEENSVPQLEAKYVKTGQISYEFRNYLRNAIDLGVALIAQCNGEKSFFPLTKALYHDQPVWFAKVQAAPQDQLQALESLPPGQIAPAAAKLADLQTWAAARGVAPAKSAQCLSDQKATDKLVQVTSDVATQYPAFQGTPSFVINGTLVELGPVTEEQVWPTLESKIKAALGGGERG